MKQGGEHLLSRRAHIRFFLCQRGRIPNHGDVSVVNGRWQVKFMFLKGDSHAEVFGDSRTGGRASGPP